MSEPEGRKRSRFDQTEPEPARKTKFDRRSRSPSRRESESHRERTPVAGEVKSPSSTDKKDAAAAAAAAAAKINASISAKKGIQHVDVPPIRPSASPSAGAGAAKSPTEASGTLNADIYQQDGDYIRDVEVNDLRNRYTLTKGSTQKMIKEKTGADVTTRGNYYPDKALATAANPPLYLHITSQTKEGLEGAIKEIDDLMKQELPNLIDERRFRRPEREQVERDSLGRRKWPEERIPIDLEPIPGFNLRAQVVGTGGSYVKHIQQETRCRVQIKGRGSGFMEHDTGSESDEQMYLHVAGPDAAEVQSAKEMCLSLLDTVKESYDSFKERGPRGGQSDRGYGGGGGGRGGYDNQQGGGYHNRGGGDRNGSGSYGGNGGQQQYGGNSQYGGSSQYSGYSGQQQGGYGAGGAQSPQAAQPPQPADEQAQMAAWIQYYQQYPDQDPYQAYGGYAAMLQQYGQGMPQQQQQGYGGAGSPQQQQPQGYGGAGSPQQGYGGYGYGQNGGEAPPPPPEDDAPPPPPPGV